jgi:hypothetical protein
VTAFCVVKHVIGAFAGRGVAVVCASLFPCLAVPARATLPAWAVATAPVEGLACLRGQAGAAVAFYACGDGCSPVPWQLDERDGEGRWALDQGPEANPDDPPDVLDDNDEVVWMAADGGRAARRDELPGAATCIVELAARVGATDALVYAVALPAPAPRAARRYVTYDPQTDRVESDRVAVGFGAPTPRYLAVRGADGAFGSNLLDRLKVRASARLLGFIPLGRDEDDIEYVFSAWRAGPVRVLRREYQWVRLASWLRTPIFETETLMSRDSLILPVRLRLNFPPTYFFAGIEVQAVLDFHALQGWQVATAGVPAVTVGAGADGRLDGARGNWVALRGPDATLVLELERGPTLATLVPSVVYRDGDDPQPPESQAGERPALGYRLTEWSGVDRGQHWFAAVAVALAADADLGAFAAARAVRLTVTARQWPTP